MVVSNDEIAGGRTGWLVFCRSLDSLSKLLRRGSIHAGLYGIDLQGCATGTRTQMSKMVTAQRMTVGQAIKRFGNLPEMRKLVDQCYFDTDLLKAAKRFYKSEEFSAIMEFVSQHGIRPPGNVLDLGGGRGVTTLSWQWRGYQGVLVEPDDCDVVGLGAITPFLHRNGCGIEACAAVGEELPFSERAFDVVYARQVLHHVSDLDAVCAEVHRVLKPKGLFIAAREHVISSPSDLSEFLEKHPVHPYTGDENARLLSEYRAALKRAGFSQVEVLGPWDSVINHYPMMSRSEFRERCRLALCKRVGNKLGTYLAQRRDVQGWLGRYWTMRDRTPGRLYSFLAIR